MFFKVKYGGGITVAYAVFHINLSVEFVHYLFAGCRFIPQYPPAVVTYVFGQEVCVVHDTERTHHIGDKVIVDIHAFNLVDFVVNCRIDVVVNSGF